VAAQSHLGQHERGRRQRRPFRGGPSRVGEGKAAYEHRTRRGGSRRVAGGVVGKRAPAQLPGAGGDLGEALVAAGVDHDGLSEPCEDEAVAVGLLEAEVAVVGAPRAQHGGRQVQLPRQRNGDRRDGGLATFARPGDRVL
jgi:hypothetical protein